MHICFYPYYNNQCFDIRPFYSKNDQTFGYSPIIGDASIMIEKNYTSLEYSTMNNIVCGISGYNPQCDWINQELSFPDAQKGQLFIKLQNKIEFANNMVACLTEKELIGLYVKL